MSRIQLNTPEFIRILYINEIVDFLGLITSTFIIRGDVNTCRTALSVVFGQMQFIA